MAEVARMLTVEDTGKGFGAQDLGFTRWKEKKWRVRGGKESKRRGVVGKGSHRGYRNHI